MSNTTKPACNCTPEAEGDDARDRRPTLHQEHCAILRWWNARDERTKLEQILTEQELRGIPTSLLLLDVVGCRCSPTCSRCTGKLAELDARIPTREVATTR